jgi:hypothetical protein
MLVTRYSETLAHPFKFALRLTDAVTRRAELAGPVEVRLVNFPQGKYARREPSVAGNGSAFVFTNVPDGLHDIAVSSPPEAPYYRGVTFTVTLPFGTARWPAFPDLNLSDPALPLSDPAQPAAFRTQYRLAALRPSTVYPFPANATLVRGTVFAGTAELAGATVRRVGGDEIPYETGERGDYVLMIEDPPLTTQTVLLRASHPAKPDVDVFIDVVRELTVTANFVMAP